MLNIPNRLDDLVEALETTGSVSPSDIDRANKLQSLDIAQLDRQFVEASVMFQESEDDRLSREFGKP